MYEARKIKVILVLLDGLGDRTYAELGNRTPLAAANTPNLDRISEMGSNGFFHAAAPGVCLPSETAHFLMFGYDMTAFPGRGLLEAAGEGVPFTDKDVLALAHLCRVAFSGGGVPRLEYGRDAIKGTRDRLNRFYGRLTPYEHGGILFELHHTHTNDGILVVKGDVSPDISDSDPIISGAPVGRIVPLAESVEPERATKTAAAMNHYLSWCHHRLKGMPSIASGKPSGNQPNFLVTQRAGRRIAVEPFSNKWGFAPAMIASSGVYRGLAMELGFDFTGAEDTASPGDDLAERILTAIHDEQHDFIHVHTKVPDERSHNGDPLLKTTAIAELDGAFAGLLDALEKREDLLAVITADHSTPSRSGLVHSGETVPLIMAGKAIRIDKVSRFDEISAASGSLGFLQGAQLMHMILNCTDRSVLDGLRLGGCRRAYMQTEYPPFLVNPAVEADPK